MGGGTTVRLAQEQDVESARQLTNRSWINTYSSLIGEAVTREIIEDRHSATRFRSQFSAPGSFFWVAERGDQLVGHCYAIQKDGLFVDRLHVDPDQKGAGIGRALLEVADTARKPGQRIWLDVLTGNVAACTFYERVGYQKIGVTDACGGLLGIPAIIFEKRG